MLMSKFLPALVAAITLAAGLLTAVECAIPVLAVPDPVCQLVANGLCLYANGQNGHDVYARQIPQGENAFDTSSVKADVCGGGAKVTDTCPFEEGLNLNAQYKGDIIFTMQNAPSGMYFLGRYATGEVVQGNAGTGDLWVQVPDPSTQAAYYFVNVRASSQDATAAFLCSNGANAPVHLFTTFQGSGQCVWDNTGGF